MNFLHAFLSQMRFSKGTGVMIWVIRVICEICGLKRAISLD